MAQYIRMLADRDGAYDHINIVTYRAGEVYSLERREPPISQELLDGFVASGHAVEVDAEGNPLATPASKRATKPAGPPATKADAPPPPPPAPAPDPADAVAPPINSALAARLYPPEPDPESVPEAQTDPSTKK